MDKKTSKKMKCDEFVNASIQYLYSILFDFKTRKPKYKTLINTVFSYINNDEIPILEFCLKIQFSYLINQYFTTRYNIFEY